MCPLIDDVTASVMENYPREGVTIEKEYNCPADFTVMADPLQMQELLQNLIKNAVDAFPGDKGNIKISADVNTEDFFKSRSRITASASTSSI